MIHKIFIWLSVVMTLVGFVLMIIEKINNITYVPKIVLYAMIIIGIVASLVLAITDEPGKTKEKIKESSETKIQIYGNATVRGPVIGRYEKKIYGDPTTTAKQKFENAAAVIENEIVANFIKLGSLIRAINENKPEKFWDVRKPNESEDTFQERAKAFHKDYQTFIFQTITGTHLKRESFSSHGADLAFHPETAIAVNNIYSWQEKCYEDLLMYAQRLSHNISIADNELDIYSKNAFLCREKYANSRILFLYALENFLSAYPKNNTANMLYNDLNIPDNLKYESDMPLIRKAISSLFKEKASIIEEQIKRPERQEQVERLVKDPYLLFLRKMLGRSDTLTEAEYWGLMQKKIDPEGKDYSSLVKLAASSYLDSDGRAAGIYLQKALESKDLPEKARIFIQASLARLAAPDMFEGGIGIIVLDLEAKSPLRQQNVQVGDILYKMNGELIIEPAEISSMLARTKKDEQILFEVYTRQKKIRKITVPGNTALRCRTSQLIVLGLFQL